MNTRRMRTNGDRQLSMDTAETSYCFCYLDQGTRLSDLQTAADCLQDSESLDRCIQTALSDLYPPFQATSPTVLCQVLSVVQSCYRGDGLRYLIHFLLPAKQLLANLQQDACLQYCGLLFRHEGWPLCVHEKVAVQLCPLDQRLLRPGDFYLLVSPPAAVPRPQARSASCRSAVSSSPRLLVCSVSAGSRHVEQQEVSEIALRSIFSMAWLDSVNREREQRGASRLERCLLSAHGDVFRVPWEDLVYPQFISRPRTSLKEDKESSVKDGDALINASHNPCSDRRQDVQLLPATKTDQSAASSEGEDSEGEYVELMELPLPRFSPQKGSLTQSISLQHRARTSAHCATHTPQHAPQHTHSTTHTPQHAPQDAHSATHTPQQTHSTTHTPQHTPQDAHSATHTPQQTHSTTHTPQHTHTSTHTPQHAPQDALSATHTPQDALSATHTPQDALSATHTPQDALSATHTPQDALSVTHTPQHTPTDATTHSASNTHATSHAGLCSRLLEENLSQDSCGPVILTPISPTSSSAPPEVVGTSSCQSERWTSQEQRGGTDSGGSLKLNTEPANCTEQREEEEEVEESKEEVAVKERGKEEELREREKGKHDMVVDEDEEMEEELKCSRDEDLLLCTHTAEEGGEREEEEEEGNECEETEGEEELDEEGGDEFEEVELEEEVQVRIVQQSQGRRVEEEQMMTEDKRGGEGEDDDRGEQRRTDEEAGSCTNTSSEDSDCEKNRQYTVESNTQHSEDSYSENNTQHTQSEDTYSENTLQMHNENSYSENNTQHIQSEDTYSENTLQMHNENSYSENNTQHTHSQGTDSENKKQLAHSEDSNSENNALQTHMEESNTPAMDPDSLPSESGQERPEEEDEEEEEQCSCEEVGGGRTTELQTEGLSSLSAGPSPTEPEQPVASPQPDQSAASSAPVRLTQSSQSKQSSFYRVLLSSGALCLPGTRDRSGRALLAVSTTNTVWSNPDCDSAELLRLLLYYTSTLRKEVAALGLTVLVDARRAAPVPALFSALRSLQENVPGSIHTVFLLVSKDSSLRPDRPAATQVEVLSSLKSVQKHVALQQLPAEFGGSFSFSQSSWLCFRSRVEQLTSQCENVVNLLQKTINILQSTPLPAAAQDAELLLSRYKAVMRSILEDSRLVQLQQEGGASLSRLRREESSVRETEDYRAAMETVSSLYEEVDELLHRLVMLSNSRTQELHFILEFRSLEQGFTEVSSWLEEVGEVRLKSLSEPEDSLELLNKKQHDFKDFHTTAYERCRRGEALLARLERWGDMSSADLHVYEAKVHSFWAQLQDFSQRVNASGQNIERAVRLYRFLDQAYAWALEGMRHLAGISMEECTLPDKCQAVIGCLEDYHRQHPPIPDGRFQEMKAVAGELRGERGLCQWSFAWSKCQETKMMFDRKMEAALRTRDSAHRQRSDSTSSRSSASSRKTLSGLWGVHETSCPPEEDSKTSSLPRNTSSSSLLSLTPTPRNNSSSSLLSLTSSPPRNTSSLFTSTPAPCPSSPPHNTSSPPRNTSSSSLLSLTSSPPRNTSSSSLLSLTSSPPRNTSSSSLLSLTSSPPGNTSSSSLLSLTSSPPGNTSSSSLFTFTPAPCPSSPPRNTSSSSLLSLTSSLFTHAPCTSSPLGRQHTPLLQRLFRSSSSGESSVQVETCSSSSSPPPSSFSSSGRRQQLRKTQSFDCPSTPEPSRFAPCPRALSEPVRRGNTGVFIRGLEVSSSEAADHTLCPRTAAHSWAGQRRGPGTPGTSRTSGSPATESRPRGSKLRHVVEEMVTTEREYVRSLRYIIHHYFPEMDRADLPQDLRGKRSVVFGNLEKLLDFHSQFFLRELEACWKHPLRVPHCFLRHQEQFGLYALYSKNKPKSDALLANHGNSFFRRKQVELGDKMDLSSYLLKPVQRMSKYALLLTDLMKEVGVAQEAELGALQAATNMVKFQLRHGNDLLAMDAIRDCDVNLKEQGQLIRQDEFTVWTGRRKSQRHVFLFEELVLFSKPKKMEGGLDVFIYKHSFKTADVGLTESTGDNGLRFEIWFRRRTSKNQTFILQAATLDVKHTWTADIARILWNQATRNKEMRLKEMVSMGVGNKPFLDIQPSDAAISDRAVHYIMKSRGARTRASIAVSAFDHSHPFKRGAVTSDPSASGPSSSGLLGPLNLHMYSQTLSSSPAAESSFITSCIEEDEQEHETSSQPSMTTESSGSSSRCLSGSTGSDSGCVSSHLQEALPEEQSPPSQPCSSSSNKQHLNSQYISPKAAVIGPATMV